MPAYRTLLLVEDDDIVRRYLTQLLEKKFWKVTAVRSGSEALAALASSRFDIVLCDLDLGAGINDVQVLNRMPEASRGTPFVILTAHGTIDRFRDALRQGASDFLEKPISASLLFSALDRAMGITASPAETSSVDDSAWRDTIGDEHVRRALRKIEREFSNPELTVETLAKSIDVTPDHLARLFRTHLGRKPHEVIQETRISASEGLLEMTTLSIYEVAVDCGYRNTTELDGWFRHFKHMTPSEWRDVRRRQG